MTPVYLAMPLLLLAFIVSACGADSPEAPVDPPDAPGPYGVGHISFTAVDADRSNRSLLVDVWYPADAPAPGTPRTKYPLAAGIGLDSDVAVDDVPVAPGEHALLVFSHGYGGIHTQSVKLMEALASHGFVVASPEHTGNAQASLTDEYDQAAANRVPDVSFVIDTVLGRGQDTDDAFFDHIDGERVGVLGHSFGGMTAIGMAAGWAGAAADERVRSIAPISAVIDPALQRDSRSGPNAGFGTDQLAGIGVSVMLMGGTKDTNVPIANNQLAFDQLTNAADVYRVDIVGATHTHFANICAIGNLLLDLGIGQNAWPDVGAKDLLEPYAMTCTPDAFSIEEATRLQNLYLVAFFKRHLLDQRGYDAYLSNEYAEREPAVAFSAK